MFEVLAIGAAFVIGAGVTKDVVIPVGKAAIETVTELYDKEED